MMSSFSVGNSSDVNDEEPTVQIDQTVENIEDGVLTVEVLGNMPKVVKLEGLLTVQILLKNNSHVKEHELLEYKIMKLRFAQMSIDNKVQLPCIIGVQSQHIFDINLRGEYLGRSSEKVAFIFKDTDCYVEVIFNVIEPVVIFSYNIGHSPMNDIDLQKLFELHNDTIVSGGHSSEKVPPDGNQNFSIPFALQKCFWKEDAKFVGNYSEIQNNISKFDAAAFEALSYQNYREKFHTLLFMEEIEVTIYLQKYARERSCFEQRDGTLSFKIQNLSQQHLSLFPGDRVVVTDLQNCTKRLGESGKYEGFIHTILGNDVTLKLNSEFPSFCGSRNYNVNFFKARMVYRKQHEFIDELWKKNRLGESFLFPFQDSLEYQPPKLKILSLDENDTDINPEDNLNENITLLPKPKIIKKINWFHDTLNKEQKTAVINILKGEGRLIPYIIYGPPGTGKTTTLVETIIQVYNEFPQSKLLVCAPTNSAVDILLDNLISSGLFDKTVLKRFIGFLEYLSPSYIIEYDDYCFSPNLDISKSHPELWIIKNIDIPKVRIVVTTAGLSSMLPMMGFKSGVFTHIFLDEAGQTTEPETLLALAFKDPFKDGQVVLAGDPKQLGPVVTSLLAKNNGLGQSMFGRFVNYSSYQRDPNKFPEYNGYNPKVITHLICNYRSLPEIVNVFSRLFYNALLVSNKTNDNVEERIMLNDLNRSAYWNVNCKGPVFVHGIEGEDRKDSRSTSWFNAHEAFQVLLYVISLMNAGILVHNIGIISPYASQVSKIKELLTKYFPYTDIPKVGTVEMFQGQERMVIILSIVRSKSSAGREEDKNSDVGFLAAPKRTNVALSRAKALLIIVGNPSTMILDKKWKEVLTSAILKNNYLGCHIPIRDLKCIQNQNGH